MVAYQEGIGRFGKTAPEKGVERGWRGHEADDGGFPLAEGFFKYGVYRALCDETPCGIEHGECESGKVGIAAQAGATLGDQ